ncbi:SMI1/KNR4 family protein [Paraliomyxa miuraensis]|uniref:SMI1/KNR4 family protein n=1 Tax=Paraliomyxa miuraensis TaxID=376150 RepID=UPI002251B95E|nr:SMI1/KNR4 family protein [Paraliomyxa miuraensis]MCX4245983.1 SMI1/KNR4 family protein [Paraliomyxa miuraensis]
MEIAMALDEMNRALKARNDVAVGEGALDEAIDLAEAQLEVAFPPDVREYLRRFGHVEVGHLEFFGLGRGIPSYLDIVQVTTSERTETGCPLPKHLVPVLNDGGGNLYCAFSANARMSGIVLWDHEAGPDQVPEPIASSLEAWFLDVLRELDA